jgi:hypothetical protein
MRIRQMTDGPVKQNHYILMPRASIIIEPHQALSAGKEVHSRPEGSQRELRSKKPSEPSLQSVRCGEAAAPGRGAAELGKRGAITRSRSEEAAGIALDEVAYNGNVLLTSR